MAHEWPEKLQLARVVLLRHRDYISSALFALRPRPAPIGTLAVDQHWRLYYDPEVLERWSPKELASVLYHEVWHLLRGHPQRLAGYDKEIANTGGDIEINDDILAEGFVLPGTPLIPELFGFPAGLTAEEYIKLLQQAAGQDASQCGTASSQYRGASKGQAASTKRGQHASHSEDDATGAMSSSADNACGSSGGGLSTPAPPRCGSCAHGHREPWEDGPPSAASPGVSEIEADLIRREVAQKIIERHKSIGNIPGHIVRWAEEVITPKVDYHRILATAIRRAVAEVMGMDDYSFRRPSRRQHLADGVILPSIVKPMPEVAIVVDTSGSIDDEMIVKELGFIHGVIKAMGYRGSVTVLSTDAHVHTCQKITSSKQVKLVGGGRTDMGAGIAAALQLRPKPELIIVLTDGWTDWPSEKPHARVIVATFDKPGPKWAVTIPIVQQ